MDSDALLGRTVKSKEGFVVGTEKMHIPENAKPLEIRAATVTSGACLERALTHARSLVVNTEG